MFCMRRHRPVQSGTVDLSIRGHFVYRLYATDGRLLYVGLSSNVLARIGRHLSSAPWGAEIARIGRASCRERVFITV